MHRRNDEVLSRVLMTISSSRLLNFLVCRFSVRSLFKCHFPAAKFGSQHFKLNVLVHNRVSRSLLRHFTQARMEVELPVYLVRGSRVKVASNYTSYRKIKRKAVSNTKSHHFFLSSVLAKPPSNRLCSCSQVQLVTTVTLSPELPPGSRLSMVFIS